uniref:NADH dehydrogenase [ubiquinone] 1 beta subcomplex subunit 6 n=1 Tax=Callithrix jacchus TaxID=9483 RepID=A0A8I3W4L7_CALJA
MRHSQASISRGFTAAAAAASAASTPLGGMEGAEKRGGGGDPGRRCAREPVLPPEATWPMDRFWDKFLANKSPWRNTVYKVYGKSMFIFTYVLIPAWIVHYYMKYHMATKPYAIVQSKLRIFPGDTIVETGEVIPPMKEFPDQHH